MITYNISFVQPQAHMLEVAMSVPLQKINQDILTFKLPAWIPGSYMIRDFARHIVSIRAELDGETVAMTQTSKHSWCVHKGQAGRVLKLVYQVYAFDLSVRGCFLDMERAFINPACLCLALDGTQQNSCQLILQSPPAADIYKNWQVATALPALDVNSAGFGIYQANNYAHLIDSPFEIGTLTRFCFEACGIAHEFILSGKFDADLERLKIDTQKICTTQIKLFDGQAPFYRYVFLLHVSDDIYGGLEHRDSTALLANRDCLPAQNMQEPTEEYIQLLGLISHEYFHAWHVKAIKPELFVDCDLEKEVYTEQLWAFEGITSYYDDLMLLRAGLISKEKYLDILAKNITRVQRGNGRNKQTLTESSFTAWTKFYKQDENSANAIVSYYQKGALFALGLDLLIRSQSDEQKSLDDVMRAVYQKYCETGKGIVEGQWPTMLQDILGLDLSEYFEQGLHTTNELVLEELFDNHNIHCYWQIQDSSCLGGFGYQKRNESACVFDLGVKYQSTKAGLKVTQVLDRGLAQSAGINVGDELIAINGFKITDINKQLQRYQKEQQIIVHLFRHGVLKDIAFKLADAQTPNTCFLAAENLNDIKWLG